MLTVTTVEVPVTFAKPDTSCKDGIDIYVYKIIFLFNLDSKKLKKLISQQITQHL